MLAFKVVEKRTRLSSNILLMKYDQYCPPLNMLTLTAVEKYFKGYANRYRKGSVIKALPNSPGICCFKDIISAKQFAALYDIAGHFMIVKVEGKNEIPWGKYPLYPRWGSTYTIGDTKTGTCKDYCVSGFIGFKSVTVLE